jgi:spermidine dehydrogenase
MIAGAFHPPFDPDKPIVLTFYMGLYTPGKSAAEQGNLGRERLLSTSFAEYESRICKQMTTLFADAGFDARRDIAGIVLNRWGHARVIQPPGFYYGRDGKPSPREIVQKGYGRIAIALRIERTPKRYGRPGAGQACGGTGAGGRMSERLHDYTAFQWCIQD